MATRILSPNAATEGDDFYVGSGSTTIIALGGDDIVYGDFIAVVVGVPDPVPFVLTVGANPVGVPQVINDAFSRLTNPDVDFDLVPHATLFRPSGSQSDLFEVQSVQVGARLVIDLDYGNHPFGNPGEFVIDLIGPNGQLVAQSIGTERTDRGSVVPEPFIDLLAPQTGSYLVRVREKGNSVVPQNLEYVLHVSTSIDLPRFNILASSNDNISGGAGNDVLYGMRGNDVISGGTGNDLIDGGSGNDTLFGGAGNDVLVGGEGFDTLSPGSGADLVFGGPSGDFDVVDYVDETSGATIRLDGIAGGGSAAGDRIFNIDSARGTNFNDVMFGNHERNSFLGRDGNDLFFGVGSTGDAASGGDGNDTFVAGDFGGNSVTGGDGVDTVSYAQVGRALTVQTAGSPGGDGLTGIERFVGTRFNDTFTDNSLSVVDDHFDGFLGVDRFFGGTGNDTVSYASATAGVGARLDGGPSFGQATGEVFNSIENLIGSRFDDVLVGNNQSNILNGGAGDDTSFGDGGNDTFIGGPGADRFNGGAGIDRVSYAASTRSVGARLDGVPSFGDAAGDTFELIESLTGSRFGDLLHGNNFNNTLFGGDGDDRLFDVGGADVYFGGDGDDIHFDGGGADQHFGGNGDDTVSYQFLGRGVGVDLSNRGGTFLGAAGDLYVSIENLIGTNFADRLTGNGLSNTLDGGGGVDKFFGGDGADTVDYSRSAGAVGVRLDNNALNFGLAAGETYDSIEIFIGSRFNDVFVGDALGNRFDGGAGADTFFGGNGGDEVTYESAAGSVGIRLDTNQNFGQATGDRFFGIEGVTGSRFDDVMVGAGDTQLLSGLDGNDTIFGGADPATSFGGTFIVGGNGNDMIFATGKVSSVTGGNGDDVIAPGNQRGFFGGGDNFDTISFQRFGASVDTSPFTAFAGQTFGGFEQILGSNFNDTLRGGKEGIILRGLGGNDLFIGQAVTREIFDGGIGNDVFLGGDGPGKDSFLFRPLEGNDRIREFNDDTDQIRFIGFGFQNAADALTRAVQQGTDVVFFYDQGGSLRIDNTTKTELFDDIFLA